MKLFKKFTALALVLSVVLLASCSSSEINSSAFISCDNFAADATIDGAKSGKEGGHFDVVFPSETTLNTVVLKEKGNNITEFSIQTLNEETQSYETVYTQDEIGNYRYCAFDKITTKSIRILISGASEKYNVKSVEAYNVNHLIDENEQSFRVTSYVTAESIYNVENLDAQSFDTITDIVLFGVNSFDEDGNINYVDKEIDGKTVPGRELFDTALSNLRQVIGERDVKIHVNFLGPDAQTDSDDWNDQMNDKASRHTNAFKGQNLANYIGQFVKDHNVDGAFFDYEYPLKSKDFKAYSKFLIDMKKELGDKTLGVALSSWNLDLSTQAIESVDVVEVMAYDAFDERGNHADFNQFAEISKAFTDKGFDIKQLDLGVPFYGRPTDSAAYWYTYSSEAGTLGKFKNLSNAKTDTDGNEIPYPNVGRYYNSYQMIFDKTAYALNSGAGGMMIWHYSCDLPASHELSLLRAMNSAIETRSK